MLRVEEFTEAFEQQKRLETALERLLDILLDRDADRKDLEEKIERYEQMRDIAAEMMAEGFDLDKKGIINLLEREAGYARPNGPRTRRTVASCCVR